MPDKSKQDQEWQILHDRIDAILQQYGQKDAFAEGDYWLLDDNWGTYRQELEIQKLALLRPEVIKQLQGAIADYPGWEVTVRVYVPAKKDEWPGMGLIISRDAIVDELRREYLPSEFRNVFYN